MNELSFTIKDSKDFLNKLIEDHFEYEKDVLSSRVAINCAMTAWHLIDWIYHEFKPNTVTLFEFQNELKTQCSSLKIMHDITKGSKHYRLTRHKPEVKRTDLHRGGFSSGFSLGFNVSVLYIENEDGSNMHFESEIAKVISFWQQYFKSELGL